MIGDLISAAGVAAGLGVGLTLRSALSKLDERKVQPPEPPAVVRSKPRPVMHVPSGVRR